MAPLWYNRLPLEGGLREGLWLYWLEISLERPEETWVPGGVDAMDEALRDCIVLLRPDKWLDARGLVLAVAWNSTRMPARALAIYHGSRCLGILYYEAVLAGPPIGFLDGRTSRGHTATSVCRWYHIFHSGLGDGGPHPLPDDGYICWLLQPPAESSQVLFCEVWACYKGDIALCWNLGDADWDTPYLVLGFTIDRSPPQNPRLATSGGEGGKPPGGLARKVAILRWPPGPDEGSPLRHPNVLHVGFSDACRGAAAPRECHAEFFLAWGRP